MGWREAVVALVSPRESAAQGDEERMKYYAPSQQAVMSSTILPEVTTSTAAQSVAIRSTTDLIASLASELPINVWKGDPSDPKKGTVPGNVEDPGGDGTGREDWGYRLLQSWLLAGNNFGTVVDRDKRTGRMLTADLVSMDQIGVTVVDGRPRWTINGNTVNEPGNFVHWRVNPVASRVLGLSPIEHHAAVIGVSLATTRFGRAWFADGAHSSVILSHEGEADAEQLAIAKARYMASLGTREPITLAGKWSHENLQVSPEESQFLQTSGMSEAQCARIFGPGFAEILGYETGQKMTYGNVVDRRQDLLVLGMSRWFRRYERVLSRFLPAGEWIEINRDALLESTTLQRYQAHNLALAGEWKTINEVRGHENLAPVPWGDEPRPSAAALQLPDTSKGATDGNSSGA